MSEPYLKIDRVSMWYPVRGRSLFARTRSFVKAVDKVELDMGRGEILGLIGESGCGKSTLGRLLVRLEEPSCGDVRIEGVSSRELVQRDARAFHRRAQIVFQNPYDSFTPRDTIEKILMRPLRIHGIGRDDAEREKICLRELERGGLIPAREMIKRLPHQLSGGQLQRISIIRAMLLDPGILVADEPVSMLDVSVRAEIINMLLALRAERQTSLVFISHDIALTRYISDHIAVMYLGRIVEYGPTDEVILNPLHPYTRALVSNCGSIDPQDVSEKIVLEGEPPTPIDPGPGCYFASRCDRARQQCFKEYPASVSREGGHYAVCHRIGES